VVTLYESYTPGVLFCQRLGYPPLYSSVILIYLLTTRWVHRYPISYPVGYPGNELPNNGSPNCQHIYKAFVTTTDTHTTQRQEVLQMQGTVQRATNTKCHT